MEEIEGNLIEELVKFILKSLIFLFLFCLACRPLLNYYNDGVVIGKAEVTRCGIIIDKKDPTQGYTHKSNTRVEYEPLFIVDFGKSIGIQDIHPTWNDFYVHEKGDTVCYKLHQDVSKVSLIMDMLGAIILAISAIVLFAVSLCWIFDWE